MKYKFEIDERAIGKQRPRYSKRLGRMYTPTKTSNFEDKVRWAFKSKYNIDTEPSEKPFRVKIIAVFEPPKSMSKKKKEELVKKEVLYTNKSDIDNISKIILDSLNNLAYKDDKQVAILEAKKQYGNENIIYIELEELNVD